MNYTKKEATELILNKIFDTFYDVYKDDLNEHIEYIIDDITAPPVMSCYSTLEYKAVVGLNHFLLTAALGREEYSEQTTKYIHSFADILAYQHQMYEDDNCIDNMRDSYESYRDIVEQELYEKDYLDGISVHKLNNLVESYAIETLGFSEQKAEQLATFYKECAEIALNRDNYDRY